MGLWSWLFPSKAERLATARALMAEGRFDEARHTVRDIPGNEAEQIYDEADRQLGIVAADVPSTAEFEHAYLSHVLHIAGSDGDQRKRFFKLLANALVGAKISLDRVEVDLDAFSEVVSRVQQQFREGHEDDARYLLFVRLDRR